MGEVLGRGGDRLSLKQQCCQQTSLQESTFKPNADASRELTDVRSPGPPTSAWIVLNRAESRIGKTRVHRRKTGNDAYTVRTGVSTKLVYCSMTR